MKENTNEKFDFIGREIELKKCYDNVSKKEGNTFILYYAESGMGKTWLLKKIRQKVSGIRNRLSLEIIELSSLKIGRFGLLEEIISKIEKADIEFNKDAKTKLDAVKEKIKKYTDAENGGASQSALEEEEKDIVYDFQNFMSDYVTNNKRLIIFIDTYDKDVKTDNIDFIISTVIALLENFICIIMGRDSNNSLNEKIEQDKEIKFDKYIKNIALDSKLSGVNNTEIIEKRRKKHNNISVVAEKLEKLNDEEQEKIIKDIKEYKKEVKEICDGSPLLLNLSNYVLGEKDKVDKEEESEEGVEIKEVVEIKEILKGKDKSSKKELTDKYKNLLVISLVSKQTEDIDKFVYQCLFIYRYGIDKNLLHKLLSKKNSEYTENSDNVKKQIEEKFDKYRKEKYINVRGNNIFIHVALPEYVEESYLIKILQETEIDKNEIIKHYEIKVDDIKNKLKQVKNKSDNKKDLELKNELANNIFLHLYYLNLYNFEEDYNKFLEKYTESAIKNDDYDVVSKILKNLQDNEDDNVKFQYARYLRNIGSYDKAIDLLKYLVESKKSTTDMNFTLAFCHRDSGNLTEALEIISDTKVKIGDGTLAKVKYHNNRGQILRDQGNLSQAVTEFLESIKISDEKLDKDYLHQYVSATTNLANTYLYQGNLIEARKYIDFASDVNENFLKREYFSNMNKLLLALIEAYNGQFGAAYNLIEAPEIYFSKNNNRALSLVLINKARIKLLDYRLRGYGRLINIETETAIKELNIILTITKRCDKICERYNKNNLAESYLQTATIYIELGKLDEGFNKKNKLSKNKENANIFLRKAYEAVGDLIVLVNIIERRAEYYYTFDDSIEAKIKNINQQVRKIKKVNELKKESITNIKKAIDIINNENNIINKDEENNYKNKIPEPGVLTAFLGEIYYLLALVYEAKFNKKLDYEESFKLFKISIPYLKIPGAWPALNFKHILDHFKKFIADKKLKKEDLESLLEEINNAWKEKNDNGNDYDNNSQINNQIIVFTKSLKRLIQASENKKNGKS